MRIGRKESAPSDSLICRIKPKKALTNISSEKRQRTKDNLAAIQYAD
jgi:hypothetical protein